MSIVRSKWTSVILNLFLCTIFFWIWAPANNLLYFINFLFYFSCFYLFTGLVLWVVRGGLFDGVTFGMRRFVSEMSRNKDYLDDWKDRPLPSKTIQRSFLSFFLFQGVLLALFSIILLIVYYR
ncbi:DUF3899 domain-containing protein [Halobacillus naozhouensis]|uniref:DUF3899 domain-containing protein n=1 Tax=Halobacillus naozhouensis TaxID=554880 RepID=A0ABY8J3Z5_9BACI|nr:DUF3899 domain-containing protein [Halobacillus naozhouensis]WFT76164.1 DUF3899 domain-containing protein [Halobacillus naozhouensis]